MKENIRLTPHGEQLLEEQLALGPHRSPEEVIEQALETYARAQRARARADSPVRTLDEAVADILEIQSRNRLGELRIKDLIHEGHKY